jgi:hypothetical protein
MKLLLENWKKYLLNEIEIVDNEEEEEYDYDAELLKQQGETESKFFGSVLERAQELAVDISRLMFNYEDYGEEGEILRRAVERKGEKLGLNVKYLGSGASRFAISVDNDFVIKIAKELRSTDIIQMNKDDYNLGTNPSFGGIFPRVYKHGPQGEKYHPDFFWIIMEKATPLVDNRKIASFFKSSFVDSDNLDESEAYAFLILMSSCIVRGSLYYEVKPRIIKLLQKKNPNMSTIDFDMINQDFMRYSDNFRKIVRIIKEYPNLDVMEALAIGNCGVGYDGRFVIIDSSIF